MQDLIIYKFDQWTPQENDNYIIGAFEAFHLGHFQLYKKLLNNSGRKVIVTFNNENLYKDANYFFQDNHSKYLNFAKLNIDCVVELDFQDIKNQSGQDFINKLTNNLPAKVIVGKDFRFGKNAKYKASDLSLINPNLQVEILEFYKFNNSKISTSELKQLVEFGDIKLLNSLLVYNYNFSGTLNIDASVELNPNLTPLHSGIYLAKFVIKNFLYYGLFIKEFNKNCYIYIFDLDLDIKIEQIIDIEIFYNLKLITKDESKYLNDDLIEMAKKLMLKFVN
ncbi:FAD synthase [Mycoplasmopsis synoviae]|uniref:FAD synthase n=1 Tax=Mycoplasmopsis synoviae TaxID=2109 RepID=UPI003563B68D